MSKFYLGYGHPSIADCATAVVFVEGVTHVAAKAIQDHALYNGQEMSTRYVECARRPLLTLGDLEGEVQRALLRIYGVVYAAVAARLEAETPDEGPAAVRRNAIHAGACDVARGFLPIGSTTQLSWTTTLRQFGERLASLAHHPLDEVRSVTSRIHAEMVRRYPGSFKLQDYPTRAGFYAGCAMPLHYARRAEALAGHDDVGPGEVSVRHRVDRELLAALPRSLWADRPAKTTLPRAVGPVASFSVYAPIDYGSFRDLQRHRGGHCRIPLVEGPLAIHPWYLERLAPETLSAIEADLAIASSGIERLRDALAPGDDEALAALQYVYPLGQVVPARVDYDLCQTVYVVEMRGTRHVHPTLRKVALQMADAVAEVLPELPTHLDDFGIDAFNLARGTQTILARPA
jgi:hypothetical protein